MIHKTSGASQFPAIAGRLLVACFVVVMMSATSQAQPTIRYNVGSVVLSNVYEITEGFIVTDGSMGPLMAANITDYSISVSGEFPYVFRPSNPNFEVIIRGTLTATPDELFLPIDLEFGAPRNELEFFSAAEFLPPFFEVEEYT